MRLDLTGIEYYQSIESHLYASSKLLVVCSPNSRASKYVEDEINRWIKNKSSADIIAVLIGGTPNNEAVEEQEKAFPEALVQVLPMPLATDFRGFKGLHPRLIRKQFTSAWYKTLADLLGLSREQIEQRERRRFMRTVWAVTSVVLVVSLALSALAGIAIWQARESRRQAERVQARALATLAQQVEREKPNQLDFAALLTIESLSREPTLDADQLLRSALMLLPATTLRLPHDDEVNAVVAAADGSWIATASKDKFARVWNVNTGKMIARLPHQAEVNDITLSPDGRLLVTASGDKQARIWDTGNWTQLASLKKGRNNQRALFSGDGRWLAIGSSGLGTKCFVWEVPNWQDPKLILDDIRHVAFAPDGKALASITITDEILIHSLVTAEALSAPALNTPVTAIAFVPEKGLVVATSDGAVTLFAAENMEQTWRTDAVGRIRYITVAPDNGELAAMMEDRVAVISPADGKVVMNIENGRGVTSVSFDREWRALLTTATDGTVRVWDRATGKELLRGGFDDVATRAVFIPGRTRSVAAVSQDHTALIIHSDTRPAALVHTDVVRVGAISPDGQLIATGMETGAVKVWEMQAQRTLADFKHNASVTAMAFSPDGRWLATSGWDKTVWLRDLGQPTDSSIIPHDNVVYDLAWAASSTRLVSASGDEAIVWDIKTRQPILRLPHSSREKNERFNTVVYGVAVDEDRNRLATIALDSNRAFLHLYDLTTGELFFEVEERGREFEREIKRRNIRGLRGVWYTFLHPADATQAVAFAPDGTHVISASLGQNAKIWAIPSGALTRNLPHDGRVIAVVYSPDGKLVATGDSVGMARIWDSATGHEIYSWDHKGPVTTVRFSPDGRRLLTASEDRFGTAARPTSMPRGAETRVRVFDTQTGSELIRLPHSHAVSSAMFTPDGNHVVSLSGHTMRLHLVNLGTLITLACKRVGRTFTNQEWLAAFGAESVIAPICEAD